MINDSSNYWMACLCNDEQKCVHDKKNDFQLIRKNERKTQEKSKIHAMRIHCISISHMTEAFTHHLRSTSNRCLRHGSSSCSSSSQAFVPSCSVDSNRSLWGTKQAASDFPSNILDFLDAKASVTLANDGKCCCSLHTSKTCTIQQVDARCEAWKLKLN